MPTFITRVELHNATGNDYATLHAAMTEARFQKFIVSIDGKSYALPTGTYYSHGSAIDAVGVRELARTAADTTGRASWVLTMNYNDAAFYLNELVT